MYIVSKKMVIAAAHKLRLNYDSLCNNIHGHNWIITVHCAAEKLNENGMVIDFKHIKEKIHGKLDHKYINEEVGNPTAENIAEWACRQIPHCYKVEVEESPGNTASYINSDIAKTFKISIL